MTRVLFHAVSKPWTLGLAALCLAACGPKAGSQQQAGSQKADPAAPHSPNAAPAAANPAPAGQLPAGHPPMGKGPAVHGPMGNVPVAHPPAGKAPAAANTAHGPLGVPNLKAKVPAGWKAQPPKNQMRKAQYVIADKGGEASFIVFQFPGGAGAAKQNLDRWVSQFDASAAPSAKRSTSKQGDLTIHALDIQGEYKARAMPGQDPKAVPTGKQRLLAAVVEGKGDPVYLKLLGPIPTLNAQEANWKALLSSLAQ